MIEVDAKVHGAIIWLGTIGFLFILAVSSGSAACGGRYPICEKVEGVAALITAILIVHVKTRCIIRMMQQDVL